MQVPLHTTVRCCAGTHSPWHSSRDELGMLTQHYAVHKQAAAAAAVALVVMVLQLVVVQN